MTTNSIWISTFPQKRMTSFQMEQDGKMATVDLLQDKVPEKIIS